MPAWTPAFLMQGYDSASSCLANFAPTQNSPNTMRPEPRKNSLKLFLFYIGGGEKFIKGVFARFRPRPACAIIQ